MPPLSHPQAQFVPISPDIDVAALVESSNNFDYVTRLPKEMLKEHSAQSLEQLILLHVVIGGKPLVIEGWEDHLDLYRFSPEWLQAHMGKTGEKWHVKNWVLQLTLIQEQRVRDIPSGIDIPMTMGHYLRSMEQLTNQFTTAKYRNPKRQRLYLKDIDTPEEWAKDLKALIPETFYYLNDCIESRTGGDGAILEPNEYGQMRYGKGVAPAGDLMSSLPPEMRALNMMCYIGHEGTYTPAHREMCASLGHNVMVENSQDGNGQKAGSSLWFMTETKEREVVSEYFLSMLGHDIEVEKHFAQINAWKKAPFNVWIVEQRLGDLILIPPLAPHQVWNRGTRTMKAAWNRTTVDTLELALHEALPRARLVCRDEQYKNKAIIYYTLIKYYDLLQRDTIEPKMWKYGRIKQLLEDFKRLFALYTEILVSEMFASVLPTERDVEMLPFDSNVTCSYCRCNIFNRFLTCRSCIEGEVDTYDICMECFAMGRSCACISSLSWVEQWEWSALTQNYETWRQMLIRCDGFFDIQKSPQPLEGARKRYGRKPVAHVCQEQLKLRPWRDITKTLPSPEVSEEEPEVDDNGRVKKKKGGRGRHLKQMKGKTHACHICCHREWDWKLAFCTTCNLAYCYGVLWRAFDLMPQEVMEDRDWSCPRCLHICSCGKCRKSPNQKPYSPKGTLLGHDTKKVADFRSVESLVDFSKTNLTWLRGENDDNPQESARMKKLKEKAEAEKAREDVIDENYLDNGNRDFDYAHNDNVDSNNRLDIDPQLLNLDTRFQPANGAYNSPYVSQPSMSTATGANSVRLQGASADDSSDWVDDTGFDVDFDSYIRPNVNCSSKISSYIAPMVAQEPAPSAEAIPVSQTRMMGIGYYQQEIDGVDKILYDAPNMEESTNKVSDAAIATPAGFSLSDILSLEEMSKKRKPGALEDDTEFFVSKKQKRAAELKEKAAINIDYDSDKEDTSNLKSKRQPDRGVSKPQTYTDLGEETMPFTEDDIVVVSDRREKPRDDGTDDLELATQAMKNLTRKHSAEKEKLETKKRNTRGSNMKSPSTASPIKKERKSTWLARKEAEVVGETFPSEIPPKRNRRYRSSVTKIPSVPTPTVDISSDSDSEDDDDGRSVRIVDNDSLFGDDLVASEKSPTEDVESRAWSENSRNQVAHLVSLSKTVNSTAKRRGRPPKSRLSETTSHARAIDPQSTKYHEIEDDSAPHSEPDGGRQSLEANENKPTPKRRGRPPRNSLPNPTEQNEMVSNGPISVPKRRGRPPRNLNSQLTMTSKPTGPTQMLSLKEKLKMKGKSFKIVAGKANHSHSSISPTVLMNTSYPANRSEVKDSPLQVESPVMSSDTMRLARPGDDGNSVKMTPKRFSRVNRNSQHSVPSGGASYVGHTEFDHNIEPVSTRSTIIRKHSISPSSSPEPPASVKKGLTIIRKDEMFSSSPEQAPVKKNAIPPVQTSASKTADGGGLSRPGSRRPTVVRLVSPDEEDSSHYSTSDSEDTMLSSPFQARRNLSSRGTTRGGPSGMVARRGRGIPSTGSI